MKRHSEFQVSGFEDQQTTSKGESGREGRKGEEKARQTEDDYMTALTNTTTYNWSFLCGVSLVTAKWEAALRLRLGRDRRSQTVL
ncbi:MAG: hypothetical protein MZV64_05330 [Ignavibacteriales bacterium]|nr:hypothetical protein [Ignavibacteriales bacterium]